MAKAETTKKTTAKKETTTEKKTYNFGEKKTENINGKNLQVTYHTPKYKEAKAKAIELIESNQYKGILLESDFWILVNSYKNKTEAMYSGLIISHDGCLKINDVLENSLKFRPECVSLDKEGYNNSLVFTYNCSEQGLYECGEISKDNCKNDYPYAMALKRCFDRVVLKNSKIAYSGIYSDSESDEFTKRNEVQEESSTPKTKSKTATKKPVNPPSKEINYRDELVQYCKQNNLDMKEIAVRFKLNGKSSNGDFEVALNTLDAEEHADIGERLGEAN